MDESLKQAPTNIDTESIDPKETYVLFNKVCGQPVSLFNHNTGYGSVFTGTLEEAIQLLKSMENYECIDILTEKQYLQVCKLQREARVRSEEELAKKSRVIPIDEIEYFDFLNIHSMPGITNRIIKFTTYLEWLMKDDFIAIENRLKHGLSLDLIPKRTEEDVIEGIVTTSEKDFDKKTRNINYYECSTVAILSVMRYVFSQKLLSMLKVAETDERTLFLVNNYQGLMNEILWNIEDLCSLYSEKCGDKKFSSSIRNRYIHTLSVHQVLRQELYGRNSFHSFADIELSPSIGTIRQLIELRIRRAFGVLSYVDLEGNVQPLNMKSLFDAIKRYKNDIELPLKYENILRIYTWANGYIHSGLGDYPWLPMYIERALVVFSFGKINEDTWSTDNGIKTTQEVIDKIHNDLYDEKNEIKSRNGICAKLQMFISHKNTKRVVYNLKICKPECEIV